MPNDGSKEIAHYNCVTKYELLNLKKVCSCVGLEHVSIGENTRPGAYPLNNEITDKISSVA